MPDLQQNLAASGVAPSTLDAASRWADADEDFALGCECAYPSLQIERWGVEDDSQA